MALPIYSCLCCFLFLVTFLPSIKCECKEDMNWMREYTFSPNVTIKWNFTDDNITMIMIGKTFGWVALAFSPNNSLIGADVVLGWVTKKDNNKIYLQDRYGSADNKFPFDEKNDYQVLGGEENDTSTFICFTRKLKTCDKQDIEFNFSTLRVTAAIGEKNPTNENLEVPSNLGNNTIRRSLRLISFEYPKPNTPDIKSIDFTARNAPISPDPTGTVYWCTHFTLPKSQKKSHMVAMEPVIQKESYGVIHHYLMYECPGKLMESLIGMTVPSRGYSCFDKLKFAFQDQCLTLISTWAVGEGLVSFPPDVGYPFHSDIENKYYMIQTHYNVGNLKSTLTDNSGVRFYYTYNLRKTDIILRVVVFGIHVAPFLLIPPRQKAFSNFGYCNAHCTQPAVNEEGIHTLAVLFHAHLAARKLSLRVIRNKEEVYRLSDDSYDFDYQPISFPVKEFVIMPGDEIITECVYDTSDRNTTTVGGFGTKQEMCLVFLFYTPPTDLTWCLSYLKPVEVLKLAGNAVLAPLLQTCFGPDCPSIYAQQGLVSILGTILLPIKDFGKSLEYYLRDYPWNSSEIQTLSKMYTEDQLPLCKVTGHDFNSSDTDIASPPRNFKALQIPGCPS